MQTKDVLKSLRKNRKYDNAKEFCDDIGISYNTYQNYESGKRIPTADILIKLADFYGVSTDYLLGRDTSEPETPLDEFAQRENLEALEKKLIEKYLQLNDRNRAAVMAFLRACVAESEQEGEQGEYVSYTAEEYRKSLDIPEENENAS